jgi:hypothetical protein
MVHSLDSFNSLDFYRQHFHDVALWSQYVSVIGERHHLKPAAPVYTGAVGTFPTFIVANRWVVKFFGQLFNGSASYEIERWVNQTITENKDFTKDSGIQSPELLAWGTLEDLGANWSWPYLVFEYLPGTRIGAVFDQITLQSKLITAYELGQWVRKFHDLELSNQTSPLPKWISYADFISQQMIGCSARHAEWGTLPPHLIAQIDSYLLPVAQLIQPSAVSHLIHADLTQDHLLGIINNGVWHSNGVIDFGDAMLGSLYYELAALYLDLFSGKKRLLESFLHGYYDQTSQYQVAITSGEFSRIAMVTALLHQFNVLGRLPEITPDLNEIQTMEQLSERLWKI